ncbi:hypothetical protein AAVH_26913 [Aphelenchoides avenae]|nr:hypothetical protein AAVH_26913 [Aphelenchus avenae]
MIDVVDDWPSTSFRRSMVERIRHLLDVTTTCPYETCVAQRIEQATFQRSRCKVEYMKMLATAINAIRDNRCPAELRCIPVRMTGEWVPPDPKPSMPEMHEITS